ncbi:MAG TPA: DUF885 family protein [Mycobacteriales bacterium]|nr:DUF885 family protein [Mycobacteriales bacterium]
MESRLRALCDLSVPTVREYSGRHEYDGVVQDLSAAGVARALAALGGPALADSHDDAHLAAFEEATRVVYGELEQHRSNPLYHVANLDLACYEREYAPLAEREQARAKHVAGWPEAIDAAVTTLDAVAAPIAAATLGAARGLGSGLRPGDGGSEDAALTAHFRLVQHLTGLARTGSPDTSLGGPALARLLGSSEALPVDLDALAGRADAERDRLRAMLTEACARIAPGERVEAVVAQLLADHPDAEGVLTEARQLTAEVIEWTERHQLAPFHDGECLVGPAPESRQWSMAMMSWAAPGEPAGPSWYHVTPPSPQWPEEEQREWLQVFSAATLPAITVHEVAPGHYSHGVALRHVDSPVRRTLLGEAFIEGWAHYTEEMALDEGFRAGDARYAAGVAIEALVRVTRLACSIGLHTGTMTVRDATRRFEADAFLAGPAASSEAQRGTFDPTYGRYTWGKLAILDLREKARRQWGSDFSLPRLHRALLELGAPPLGLMDAAL